MIISEVDKGGYFEEAVPGRSTGPIEPVEPDLLQDDGLVQSDAVESVVKESITLMKETSNDGEKTNGYYQVVCPEMVTGEEWGPKRGRCIARRSSDNTLP